MIPTIEYDTHTDYYVEVSHLTRAEHLQCIACLEKIFMHVEKLRNGEGNHALITARILRLKYMVKVHLNLLTP